MKRGSSSENDKMNRLYVVESNMTLTGGMADHRLRMKSSDIPAYVVALASELNSLGLKIKGFEFYKI